MSKINNKISIVVPLYNKEKYIKRTIKSILNQTYSDFEVIIVNDGSTDDSLKIVSELKDSRIRIVSKSNRGVSHTRNEGIKKAKYDYIAFIDGDDTWEVDYLKEVNLLINEYKDVGAYTTGFSYIYKDGTKKAKKKAKKNYYRRQKSNTGIINNYFEIILNSPIIHTSSVVIPKKIFETIGMFREDLNSGEDVEMWTRIALNYKIAYSSKYLTKYYADVSDRIETTPMDVEKTFVYYAKPYYEMHKNKKNSNKYFKRFIYNLILSNCYNLVSIGDKKMAIKELIPFNIYYLSKKRFWKILLLLIMK